MLVCRQCGSCWSTRIALNTAGQKQGQENGIKRTRLDFQKSWYVKSQMPLEYWVYGVLTWQQSGIPKWRAGLLARTEEVQGLQLALEVNVYNICAKKSSCPKGGANIIEIHSCIRTAKQQLLTTTQTTTTPPNKAQWPRMRMQPTCIL